MKRSRTKVLSIRLLPWPYFRTKKLAEHLRKSLSFLTMEALQIYFHQMTKSGVINKRTIDAWLTEYHKAFPHEMD